MRKRLRRFLRSLICVKPLGFAAFLMAGITLNAATVANINFEAAGGYALTNPSDGSALTEFSDGFNDYVIRTTGTDINASISYTGVEGTHFFGVQDVNGEGGPDSVRQTFDAIDISGFENLQFSILIAEDNSNDGNEDWDENSAMKITYSIDGGTFQNLIAVESTSSSFNNAPAIDTNFDGTGDGAAITDAFTEFSASIAGTGSSLVVRIDYENLQDGDEDVAIDNLVILGDLAGPAMAQKSPAFLNATHINASDNNSVEFYASGNDDSFSEYGVASYSFRRADFGIADNEDIDDISAAEFSVVYNDRSFSDGSGFEIFLTTQEFGGNYSGLTYNPALINGLDVSHFTSAPVSLGTVAFDPNAAGGSTNTYALDFGSEESAVIAKLNSGGEFSLIIAVTNANDDVTFSGLENAFDPGEPMLKLSVTSVAGSDTTPPVLSSLSPVDDNPSVAIDANLVITFAELVQAATGNITIHLAADDSVVETIDASSGQVSVSGATVTINPASDLAQATAFYVNVAPGAIEDVAGNDFAGIIDASTWNFTTVVADVAPIITVNGPFTISDQSPNGAVVGDINADNDGLIDDGVRYSITGIRRADSMAVGVDGWEVEPIFTVGTTINGYTPPGILDGLGAYNKDANTVRVFANHELLNFRGYDYDVSNGAGGTFSLDGARVSFFDIDKTSMAVVDSGLAYNTIYDANGNIATDNSFLANNLIGFSRFCSAQLVEAHQFGNGRGLENRIFFTGEEDGSGFNSVGGAEWALDPATGNLWHVPAMGRGAWENITEIDTMTTTHVAFLLADDSSPFDADGDLANEAAPLYLYVGQKNPTGDFLEQNGLRGGALYVWKSDTGDLTPTQFNGSTSRVRSGTWIQVANNPAGTPSEDGSTTFDEFGFPTQRNLWGQAEQIGAFTFSRPEDLATNPHDGSQAVLASTGVDTFENGIDTFGTIYVIDTDFSNLNQPTSTIRIAYDGDFDPTRALRSPDNLDWADDGFIYVQEDEAEEDTLDGEVLFGSSAINPNEAGIVRLDPVDGSTLRVANIDRSINLDASLANPFLGIDRDAGAAGEWESSGILEVSSLFGRQPGELFIFTVQAHGIEDQNSGMPANAMSRIDDNDLVEGGQLLLLERTAEIQGPSFRISPNTGVIVVQNHLDSTNRPFLRIDVEVSDGAFTVPTTVTVAVNNDPVAAPETLRVATFNTSMNRGNAGDLIAEASTLNSAQIASVAQIIQINRPDVVLLNEIDFDPRGEALRLFRENYLEVSQNGKDPIYYNYWFIDDSNTGIPSGFDFNNNGSVETNNNDAFGFGNFEGQFAMAILSKYPIAQDQVRTFQQFLWKDMPNALLPPDPADSDGNSDTANYFTPAELDVFRLSSKSHWDVPVWFQGQMIHALASHPTPPVFDDGTETDFNNPTIVDLNGRRNHDEIRFWIDYIDPSASAYIYDDREWAAAGFSTPATPAGGLPAGAKFVILGDQNADPFDGDSTGNPAGQLLASPFVNTTVTPSSAGAPEAATNSGGANASHTGNSAFDTGDFNDTSPGNLRIDYALPSATLNIVDALVYWPTIADLAANNSPDLLGPANNGASDHRMVWVDLGVPMVPMVVLRPVERIDEGANQRIRIKFGDQGGVPFTAGDAGSFTIQYSNDLRTWQTVSGALTVESGDLVIEENLSNAIAFRVYRVR